MSTARQVYNNDTLHKSTCCVAKVQNEMTLSNVMISVEDCAAVRQVCFVPENDPPPANQHHPGEAAAVGAVIRRYASWDTKDDFVQGA